MLNVDGAANQATQIPNATQLQNQAQTPGFVGSSNIRPPKQNKSFSKRTKYLLIGGLLLILLLVGGIASFFLLQTPQDLRQKAYSIDEPECTKDSDCQNGFQCRNRTCTRVNVPSPSPSTGAGGTTPTVPASSTPTVSPTATISPSAPATPTFTCSNATINSQQSTQLTASGTINLAAISASKISGGVFFVNNAQNPKTNGGFKPLCVAGANRLDSDPCPAGSGQLILLANKTTDNQVTLALTKADLAYNDVTWQNQIPTKFEFSAVLISEAEALSDITSACSVTTEVVADPAGQGGAGGAGSGGNSSSNGTLACGATACENYTDGSSSCSAGLTCVITDVDLNNDNYYDQYCAKPELKVACKTDPTGNRCCSDPPASTPTTATSENLGKGGLSNNSTTSAMTQPTLPKTLPNTGSEDWQLLFKAGAGMILAGFVILLFL